MLCRAFSKWKRLLTSRSAFEFSNHFLESFQRFLLFTLRGEHHFSQQFTPRPVPLRMIFQWDAPWGIKQTDLWRIFIKRKVDEMRFHGGARKTTKRINYEFKKFQLSEPSLKWNMKSVIFVSCGGNYKRMESRARRGQRRKFLGKISSEAMVSCQKENPTRNKFSPSRPHRGMFLCFIGKSF